jgi:threonyl-tRNA synthetase
MQQENIEHIRHSLAHLLAAAVLKHFPDTNPTLGPAIENGFYYDFEFQNPLKESDLEKIENTMRELLPTWSTFTCEEVSYEKAKEVFAGNKYKLELIEEIKEKGEPITFYTSGDFIDLCRGGHVEDMKNIPSDCFKLDSLAGAYWRGSEKNKMLTRIYGLAFHTKVELDEYVTMQAEAEKRDHRKIGPALKLFTISQLVGSGLPLFQPKGTILRKELENYLWDLHKDKGYDRVWTPHLAKEDLYKVSGHAGHYLDDMFSVHGGTSKEDFYVKPMNCPHHMQIFADNQFSYRDMPVRYFEPATVYRDEKTGQLSGLTRVRALTQDDGHLFCRVSQIENEIKTIVEIIKDFYTTMGMMEGYWVRLSVRGDDKENYLGEDIVWETAESALKNVCDSEKLNYKVGKGEAAFYGPKLDFMFKDAIGREWQLATVQCDFNLPKRFELSFTNEKGEKEQPVVIHRAISGSLERFIGVAIEHFGGAFPTWMSPVQVAIIPVSEKHLDYAHTVKHLLSGFSIRTDLFDGNDSLGKRIREAKMNKIPYVLVIGDKEIADNSVTVEKRGSEEKGVSVSLNDFVTKITNEIKNRSL